MVEMRMDEVIRVQKEYVYCPCRRPSCRWDAETQECSSECVCRVVDEDLIEDAVEIWHRSKTIEAPLHEWLGWSEAEYVTWAEGGDPPGHG